MDEKSQETVASARKFCSNVSFTTGERDAFAPICKELVLDVKCMPGMAEKAKVQPTRSAELEESSRAKSPKISARRKTTDMMWSNSRLVQTLQNKQLALHSSKLAFLSAKAGWNFCSAASTSLIIYTFC